GATASESVSEEASSSVGLATNTVTNLDDIPTATVLDGTMDTDGLHIVGTSTGDYAYYVNPGYKTIAISHLTLSTANYFYRNGAGQFNIKVDARQYDFSRVDPNGFQPVSDRVTGATVYRQPYTFPAVKNGAISDDALVEKNVI